MSRAQLQVLEPSAAKNLLSKILKEDTVARLKSGKKTLADYDVPGADMKKLAAAVESLEATSEY
jgi:hypothetical protein